MPDWEDEDQKKIKGGGEETEEGAIGLEEEEGFEGEESEDE